MTDQTTPAAPAAPATPSPDSNAPSPQPSRPEGLPENFQSVQALADSYRGLQQKLSSQSTQAQPAPGAPSPSGPPSFGELIRTAQEQYAHSGTIAPGTYEAFQAQGLSQTDVDFYMNAGAAHQAAQVNQLVEALGGQQQYDQVRQWGAQHLDAGMQSYFDSLVTGGHLDAAKIFMQGVAVQMQNQPQPDPQGIQPGVAAAPSTPGGVYSSKSEWQADLNKPEYQKDPSFREAVDRKAMQSLQQGVW